MPKLHLEKSIRINAPVDQVFDKLQDFHHWPAWSPWLIMEPGVAVNVQPDGQHYSWEGNRIGAGNMTVANSVANQRIDYDLVFLKPWKSKAKVYFTTKAVGNETEVAWGMNSSLPFFMFFMKKLMVAAVGMDYERGLLMLKDYCELGEVPAKLNFPGRVQFDGFQYIGVRNSTSRSDMPTKMEADFKKLMAFLEDHQSIVTGQSFSQYHKFDIVKDHAKYTVGMSVSSIPASLPDGIVSGTLPAASVNQIEHVGAYRHLGNPWTASQMMIRNKEFKPLKKYHPFELYGNNMNEVDEKDLVTTVNFAVKS